MVQLEAELYQIGIPDTIAAGFGFDAQGLRVAAES